MPDKILYVIDSGFREKMKESVIKHKKQLFIYAIEQYHILDC